MRRENQAIDGSDGGCGETRRGFAIFSALTLVLAGACSWKQDAGTHDPSVLLITLDTTRADVLSACGGVGAAQNLDRLAQRSIVCTNARAPTPLTAPSHCSMMTGLYPFAHGVRDNDLFRLSTEARTLAVILKEKGYRTEAVIAASVLRPSVGLDLGFERYDFPEFGRIRNGLADVERGADDVAARAIARIDADDPRPLFLWVHFFDPHYPYVAHPGLPPARTREEAYLNEVRFMDEAAGKVLETFRSSRHADRSWIFVCGDHGEGLEQQQELAHGFLLEEETLRIPLLVGPPPGAPIGRITVPVSAVDVFATMLDVLDIDPPYAIHGVSLVDLLEVERAGGAGLEHATKRALWVETWAGYHLFRWVRLEGVIQEGWKYVRNAEDELFAVGPARVKEVDVAATNEPITARMRRLFEQMAAQAVRRLEAGIIDPSAEETARLQALGYLARAEDAAEETAPAALLNPRQHYQSYVDHVKARDLASQGKLEAAAALIRQVLEQYPRSPSYRELYANILVQQERDAEAVGQFRQVLALNSNMIEARVSLGCCQIKLNQIEEGAAELERALSIYPDHLDAWFQLREAHRQLRQFDRVLLDCVEIVDRCHKIGDEESLSFAKKTLEEWLPATLKNLELFGGLEDAVSRARARIAEIDRPAVRELERKLPPERP